MYTRILVPLENSATDAVIVTHVSALARHCGASLVFIHVADGWAARNINHLKLRESEEMRLDREYLERITAEATRGGLQADSVLASGDPTREIVDAATREQCDLIAMATHGHKLLGDVVYGSVANGVRHATTVPVLLVRASRADA
ncbi:MAG: universal stress protein [Gemmatimonadetes bacterium]|nr:universal stress protein [Gemmatimonadota bacterium]